MINIVRFQMSDIDNFNSDNTFVDLEFDMKRNLSDPCMSMVTLVNKSKVICIAGVKELRHGVGELWLIPSVYVKDNKINFFKTIYCLIYNLIFTNMCFHRLQMAIKLNDKKATKWADKLGFKKEGIMKAYDHLGDDYFLYAKIKKE